MANPKVQLDLVMQAQDQASAELKKVNAELAKLKRTTGAARKETARLAGSVDKLDKLKQSFERLRGVVMMAPVLGSSYQPNVAPQGCPSPFKYRNRH